MTKSFVFHCIIFLPLLCCLGGFWALHGKREKARLEKKELARFEQNLQPLYQNKATTIRRIVALSKIQDSDLQGILLHVPAWKAVKKNDIAEIEEMTTALDTHFSKHANELDRMIQKDDRVAKEMKSLQILNETISKAHKTL
jgi:DNA topoisomerase VI subunit B